ncbi:MAG: hypothetical protein JWL95_653, partial [Gemmatimonadetes bacterium]|nr:hypothetical protein [Gemmatimonadota bacterium]
LPFSRSGWRAAALRLLAVCAVLAAAPRAHAQQPRPWLDWQTVETEHFVFHYPRQYGAWTLALAQRMEGVRAQVANVVGFAPLRRVHIVVDDPINDANGVAYTTLDAPTIVLYPTPPDPREDIGNFRVWGELVATHEFAHMAHLTRPSRNHVRALLWSLSPVPLGPIAASAPRWVIEGYATYVEGRVTGTGRPNHAWRAAILRQFALEGRLPSYGQMSASGGWQTGNFAYLAGSAYFDWLSRREGDSSVTALWKRMTAKTVRSFDEAFVGVYGRGPAELYGRFVAEVTADALAFDRALARDALVSGTLVQRLVRNTGDPAISPDGRFVALSVRHIDAPSQMVVWRTADEPDTLAARRREAQLRRDPGDVPDRSFYPPPKSVVISLMSNDGAPFESPRWMPDNRHLLLTRRMPLKDGSLRGDLFIWNAEDGGLTRLTKGAGLRDADPSPDGRWAAAVRCDRGWCDLVRVDLGTGAIRVLLQGDPARNYYRPRVSKRTGEIVVAEQSGDRWRIARVPSSGGALRYADPDDGVTRFDATFDVDGQSIITTSEAGGIANLERLDATTARATRLTAVTGAAVAADVAPDGALWFLSLQSHGYDLRRLHSDSASVARAANASAPLHLALVDSLSPVLPPRSMPSVADSSRRPALANTSEPQTYGVGPSRFRYVPGLTSGFGGSALQIALVRSDPVGRFGASLLAAAGSAALPMGVALEMSDRQARTGIVANGWASRDRPSHQFAGALEEGLDLGRFGGALRVERTRVSDGGELTGTLALLGEQQRPTTFLSANRVAAIGTFNVVRRQRDEDTRYQEELFFHGEAGQTEGGSYSRQRAALFFGVGAGTRPLTTLRFAYGTVGGGGGNPRERYVIGGFASPLIDPMYDARRVDAPAYPVGSISSTTFSTFRAALPVSPFELYFAGASPDLYKTALRSYGIEFRENVPAIAALGTPEVNLLAGFARALDPPVAGEWRYYISVTLHP